MATNSDSVKGKAEKTAGKLTVNQNLKQRGRTDQAAGKVKSGVAEAKDKVVGAVDTVKNKLKK